MSTTTKTRYTTDLLSTPGMKFRIDIADPKERIQAYIDEYAKPLHDPGEQEEGIDEPLMRECIRVVSATKTPKVSCVFVLDVTSCWSNRMGNMHGGAIALVFDMCTTMCAAPLAREDFWWFGGVSRTLAVTYLRPVRMGVTVEVRCEVLQMGRRLATIRGEMREKPLGGGEGVVLCVCEHNKASLEFEGGKGLL